MFSHPDLRVNPICMPYGYNYWEKEHDRLIIAGYGKRHKLDPRTDGLFKEGMMAFAEMIHVPKDLCQRSHPKDYKISQS